MFTLPQLPYAADALAPVISEATMRAHHGKHHAQYLATVNDLVGGREAGVRSLEDVVWASARQRDARLFNNASQAWNHAFYWCCMAPERRDPSGPIVAAIGKAFGDLETLQEVFVLEGASHFGSGWAWLMAEGDELSVITTHDGESALTHRGTPLLACDLWEHAYYLDYQNERRRHLNAWFEHLANWPLAEAQFLAAQGARPPWRFPNAETAELAAA